jgi:hypothetical protein
MKNFKPVMTIRIDANTDTVSVEGFEYDRSKMSKDQKRIMRKVIVEALFPRGRRRTCATALMLIYFLSSPDDNRIILTCALAVVAAATKTAEETGVVLEVGSWDTDKSSTCVVHLDAGGDQHPHRPTPSK